MLNTQRGIHWRWLKYQRLLHAKDNVLEQKVCDVFQKIGMDIRDLDIQACHHLKDKDRTIVKFTNRKDFLLILVVKRLLQGLNHAVVDLPEGPKIFVS